MPAENYAYPESKVRYIGIMLADEYGPVTPEKQRQFKSQLNVPTESKLVFVTGGSQGARVINLAMVKVVPDLLSQHKNLHIIHQVGKGNAMTYGEFNHPRLEVTEFVNGLHMYYGAADVVVTRAGATNLAECGVQGKATIVIANPLLTGGHQLKNAKYLSQQEAVLSVNEKALATDPAVLVEAITDLINDSAKRQKLGDKLQSITPTNATPRMARLLLELVDA
jgi:UDP-N-acetylglucosamine--N-acetylmuramyl-(pentapeptide) pyrophosphoryl-undecaprenol N-acetylglucosamine transferase